MPQHWPAKFCGNGCFTLMPVFSKSHLLCKVAFLLEGISAQIHASSKPFLFVIGI